MNTAVETTNNAVAEETEFTRAKTSVWWDIENCAVPKGCDARGIAQTLSSALMKMNYCGPLTISSYGNTNLIPNSVQQALSSTGIALNHVPSGRKDASDKKILTDMFLWVLDNPAPANIMFITADGDFSDALHKLRMRRYNILLVHPDDVSPSLLACAKTTWIWRSLWPSASPPVAHCESPRLVDNGQVLSRRPMDSVSNTDRAARNNKIKGIYVPKASNQIIQHETKTKMVEKISTKTRESAWFCKVCNVACKSFENFTTHVSSKEHGDQWQLKQNLELLGEPKDIAATPTGCHEKDMKMKEKVVEAEFEASAHYGGLCSVVCPGQTSLDSNPSMKCLEKLKRDLTETCTISERSAREFWQDCKGKVESEGKASLDVDCVINELSRDFLVPKEVREYFDSILKKPEPSKDEFVIEKLEGMPKHALEMKPGGQETSPAGPNEHLDGDMKKKKKKKKKSKVNEDGAETYVCSLCSVICVCPTVFESHLKGRKHAAMITKQQTEDLLNDKKIQEEIIQDNGNLIEMIEDFQFQSGEALEIMDCLDWKNKDLRERDSTSERSIEELFQNVGLENESRYLQNAERIFFELNPEFLASEEARESLDASIKKLNISANLHLELEDLPKQNQEMSWGDPGSTSAGATGHPSEYMEKNKDKVKEDEAKPEAYVCSICNVSSDCPTIFESHLMGPVHAAAVKIHAEVFFDDKKILEESLQGKDNPRGLLFQPIETRESVKEVGQATKERVDDESEARERLDRLKLSLEDISNQKFSEADYKSEKGKENGASTSHIRVCDWCNVMCTSQMDFNSHLGGKKHAAVVKKHAGTKLISARKQKEWVLMGLPTKKGS